MSKDKRKEYAVHHSFIEKKFMIYIKKKRVVNLRELINLGIVNKIKKEKREK